MNVYFEITKLDLILFSYFHDTILLYFSFKSFLPEKMQLEETHIPHPYFNFVLLLICTLLYSLEMNIISGT